MRQTLALLSLLVAACGGSQPASQTSTPPYGHGAHAHAAPSLGFEDAIKLAVAAHPSGTPVEVEWDTDKKLAPHAVLEVEFLEQGKVDEVFLCPHRGVVLKQNSSPFDEKHAAEYAPLPPLLAAPGALTLEAAVAKAFAAYAKESVVEVELLARDGRLAVEVEVKQGDVTTAHYHDAATWQLLESKPKD